MSSKAEMIGTTLIVYDDDQLPEYEGVIDDDSEEFELIDYIKAAIASNHLSSERDLGRSLGVTHNVISSWRTGRAWPTDERMKKLAVLADGDPDEALLRLNMWRAKDPQIKKLYRHMLNGIYKLKGADYWPSLYMIPVLLTLFIAGVALPTPANAEARA